MRPLRTVVLVGCVTAMSGHAMADSAAVPEPNEAFVYDVELVNAENPEALYVGEKDFVEVVIRNHGTMTWSDSDKVKIAYHWLSPTGQVLVRDGHRTRFERDVPPGEKYAARAVLVAPREPGEYLLQWDLVHEHVCWFAEHDPTPIRAVSVTVERAPLTHAFTLIEHETPRLMWTGKWTEVDLKLRNDGLAVWGEPSRFKVSYHWRSREGDDVVFEGARTGIVDHVESGGEIEISAALQAPMKPGLVVLHWDVVEEGVTWISGRDSTPVEGITVLVVPNPLLSRSVSFILALVLTVAVLVAVRSKRTPPWAFEVLAVADVLWMTVSVFSKQPFLFDEIARQPKPGSSWIVLAGTALMTILVLLIPCRVRPMVCFGMVAVVSFVIFSDTLYLRFFGDVVSIAAFGAAGQLGEIWETTVSLMEGRDLWLWIDLLVGGVLILVVLPIQKQRGRRARWVAMAFALAIAVPGTMKFYELVTTKGYKFFQLFDNVELVREIGLVNFHVHDAFMGARRSFLQRPLGDEEYERVLGWFEGARRLRSGESTQFGVARGMNLIMIQAESLQGFAVGLVVNGQEVTPNMNAWRHGAMWFPRCTDQTHQGRTSDAELGSQASLLPAPQGAASFQFSGNDYVGVADVLREQGYTTLSAIPYHSAFWNRLVLHAEYGFEKAMYRSDFRSGTNVGWGLNDRDFLQQMLPVLGDLSQPFCSLLISLSNHHPYVDFPDELKRLDLGELEGQPIGNYLHSVHWFDLAVGQFVDGLIQRGLLANTVVAIWGDHTAGLSWSSELAEMARVPFTELGWYLADRVPLMIYVPGQSELRGTRPTRCGLVDVPPTLLALLGVDAGPLPFMGRNLLGVDLEAPVLRRRGCWMAGDLTFLSKGDGGLDSGVCYDEISGTRVPAERCREHYQAAAEKREVGRLVLRYDLQQRLSQDLGSR